MEPIDVSRILAKAAAYDRRTVGKADTLAWHEALSDLDLDACLDAVAAHYRQSTEWLMPAHVRRLVDEARRKAAITAEANAAYERSKVLELTAVAHPGQRSPEVEEAIAQVRAILPPGHPLAFRRPEWVESDRRRRSNVDDDPNPLFAGFTRPSAEVDSDAT